MISRRTARAMWTPTDIHLEDVSNVLPFRLKRGAAAQAQASYGAIALEQDRSAVRYHEVNILIENYEADIRQLQQLVRTLKSENEARRHD